MKTSGIQVFRQPPLENKFATIAALTALASVALICAIPKVRIVLSEMLDNAKKWMANRNHHQQHDWKHDLGIAEELKGPVKRRKDIASIKVPTAGTNAWKDEWSSK